MCVLVYKCVLVCLCIVGTFVCACVHTHTRTHTHTHTHTCGLRKCMLLELCIGLPVVIVTGPLGCTVMAMADSVRARYCKA